MKKIYITAACLLGATSLWADTPIQLSLTPDIALYPKTTMVKGVSLNIWGENPQVGLTVGFINGSRDESAGFSVGLVNYAQSYQGVQWGIVNISQENYVGWQHGIINFSQGNFEGYQSGWVNITEKMTGFQLGIVNYSENLNGVQVGLVNVARNNPWFDEFPNKLATGFPIVNWSF